MEYVRSYTATQKREIETSITSETQTTIKKQKVAKEAKPNTAEGDSCSARPKAKTFSDKQVNQLEKCLEKLPKAMESLKDTEKNMENDSAKEWRDLVPTYVAARTKAMQAKVEEVKIMIETALGNKEGSMKQIFEAFRDVQSDVKESVRMSNVQFEEAKKMAQRA